MLIKNPKDWEMKEKQATPESVFRNRRRILAGLGLGGIAAGALGVYALREKDAPSSTVSPVNSAAAQTPDPTTDLYPAKPNGHYMLDRPLTSEKFATTYNNFYEYGSHKGIYTEAGRLRIRPWNIAFDGMVEKPFVKDIDEVIRAMPLEERLYRHRCVEAWSMAVPWTGFSLAALVAYAKPLSSAKYLQMETFQDVAMAPGQRQVWWPWPYVEGLTMDEATNELAFMATGIYGKPMPPQNGAPLRLAVPWKYGFKSIKSIVRFTFTDKQPKSFWEQIQANEYGFWANVNPKVPHPRWSQASEQVLGTGERVPTQLYNGYAEFVGSLYTNRQNEQLFL